MLANWLSTKPYQFCGDMLALKSLCVHPETQESYIVSSSGGKDNSPEGAQVCLAAQFTGLC